MGAAQWAMSDVRRVNRRFAEGRCTMGDVRRGTWACEARKVSRKMWILTGQPRRRILTSPDGGKERAGVVPNKEEKRTEKRSKKERGKKHQRFEILRYLPPLKVEPLEARNGANVVRLQRRAESVIVQEQTRTSIAQGGKRVKRARPDASGRGSPYLP